MATKKDGGFDKLTTRDLKWMANYEALKAYIDEHKHLPDKHKVTDRNKLSWWKYQMKKKRLGRLLRSRSGCYRSLLIAGQRSILEGGGR